MAHRELSLPCEPKVACVCPSNAQSPCNLFTCLHVCRQSEGGGDVTSIYSVVGGGREIVQGPYARYLSSCHLSELLNINFVLFYFCYYSSCPLLRNSWKLRHKLNYVSRARNVINGACIHGMDIEIEFSQ